MLKNITNEILVLKWGGMTATLPPTHMIDVGKIWRITGNEISILEDRFLNKFKNKLIRNGFDDEPEEKKIDEPKVSVKSKDVKKKRS